MKTLERTREVGRALASYTVSSSSRARRNEEEDYYEEPPHTFHSSLFRLASRLIASYFESHLPRATLQPEQSDALHALNASALIASVRSTIPFLVREGARAVGFMIAINRGDWRRNGQAVMRWV